MGSSEIKRVRFFMLEILNYRLGYIGDATVSEKRVPTTFSLAWGILEEDTPIFIEKNRRGRLFLFIRGRIMKTVFYLL